MSDENQGPDRTGPIDETEAAEIEAKLGGTFTVPRGTSDTHRRRLLGAIGGASTVALAGCVGLFSEPDDDDDEELDEDDEEEVDDEDDEDDEEEAEDEDDEDDEEEVDDDDEDDGEDYPLDYPAMETMQPDVPPKELVKPIDVQIAYNDEEIVFRFEWEQPDPGGWIHDMIYYNGEEWERLSSWDPWVLDEDAGPEEGQDYHQGYYEDRLSFFLGDGSLEGFENFGGWMTVMEGVRTLPGEAPEDEVVNHPYFGEENLDRDDMRKFIPQSREGEWWEHPWDEPVSEEELEEMLENNEFLELPMWRGHRSNPMGYGTNHHVLDYRHGVVEGENCFDTQEWDEEDGPEYMFDPDIVEEGAIDRADVVNDDGTPNEEDMPPVDEFQQYALFEEGDNENMVEFDPDVAEWEGAMIPRRPLIEPSEGGAVWEAEGHWEDETWTVEMRRELDTGYVDDIPLEEGEVYEWSPAIHHGASQRWHWVAYPYKLGIGEEPDYFGDDTEFGNTELVAEEFDDDDPDWDDHETYTIPLMYPGMTDWTWLTSGEHPQVDEIQNAEINIWEHHDENPEDFAQRMVDLEEMEAPRE